MVEVDGHGGGDEESEQGGEEDDGVDKAWKLPISHEGLIAGHLKMVSVTHIATSVVIV